MKLAVLTLALIFSSQLFADHGRLCATLFQGEYQSGERLDLVDRTAIPDLRQYTMRDGYSSWDNRASSLVVMPGCRMLTFQYSNYGIDFNTGYPIGQKQLFANPSVGVHAVSDLGDFDLNDKISSLKCKCQ